MIEQISLAFAILGPVLSIFFYLGSKKRKLPVYCTETTVLISEKTTSINSLRVLFKRRELSTLTITKMAFWNAGKETISFSDLSLKDRLRVEIKDGCEILNCEVIKQTKIANDFNVQLEKDKKTVLLSFDYLDHNEGAVLRMIHTGSSIADLSLKGSIKAVSSFKRGGIVATDRRYMKEEGSFSYIWGIVFVISLIASIFLFCCMPSKQLGIVYAFTTIYYLILFIISLKWPIPRSLKEVYYKEEY